MPESMSQKHIRKFNIFQIFIESFLPITWLKSPIFKIICLRLNSKIIKTIVILILK